MSREEDLPALEPRRVLGLWDIVFFTVVAVTGLRWISRGARVGAPSVLLWVLAWLAFFVPLAVSVAVLAKRYPEQGGIYAWVHRAFGPFGSALCGWCLWVNNLFYFPSLLLFAAANAAAMVGGLFPELGDNRLFSLIFVLGFLWFSVGISIQGFEAGRWLQTLGVVGTWVPVGLLIVAAAVIVGIRGLGDQLRAGGDGAARVVGRRVGRGARPRQLVVGVLLRLRRLRDRRLLEPGDPRSGEDAAARHRDLGRDGHASSTSSARRRCSRSSRPTGSPSGAASPTPSTRRRRAWACPRSVR